MSNNLSLWSKTHSGVQMFLNMIVVTDNIVNDNYTGY